MKTGIRKTSLLTFSLYGLAALALLALSWQSRTYINPDGISYLDIAREMLKGNPGAYFHPYWSQLFPALLALATKLASPAPASVLLLAHAVIALSALAAITCRIAAGRGRAYSAIWLGFLLSIGYFTKAASFFILDVAYGHTIRREPISNQHNGKVQQAIAENL